MTASNTQQFDASPLDAILTRPTYHVHLAQLDETAQDVHDQLRWLKNLLATEAAALRVEHVSDTRIHLHLNHVLFGTLEDGILTTPLGDTRILVASDPLIARAVSEQFERLAYILDVEPDALPPTQREYLYHLGVALEPYVYRNALAAWVQHEAQDSRVTHALKHRLHDLVSCVRLVCQEAGHTEDIGTVSGRLYDKLDEAGLVTSIVSYDGVPLAPLYAAFPERFTLTDGVLFYTAPEQDDDTSPVALAYVGSAPGAASSEQVCLTSPLNPTEATVRLPRDGYLETWLKDVDDYRRTPRAVKTLTLTWLRHLNSALAPVGHASLGDRTPVAPVSLETPVCRNGRYVLSRKTLDATAAYRVTPRHVLATHWATLRTDVSIPLDPVGALVADEPVAIGHLQTDDMTLTDGYFVLNGVPFAHLTDTECLEVLLYDTGTHDSDTIEVNAYYHKMTERRYIELVVKQLRAGYHEYRYTHEQLKRAELNRELYRQLNDDVAAHFYRWHEQLRRIVALMADKTAPASDEPGEIRETKDERLAKCNLARQQMQHNALRLGIQEETMAKLFGKGRHL